MIRRSIFYLSVFVLAMAGFLTSSPAYAAPAGNNQATIMVTVDLGGSSQSGTMQVPFFIDGAGVAPIAVSSQTGSNSYLVSAGAPHSVKEAVPRGYQLSSAVCYFGQPVGSPIADGVGNIILQPGQSVNCTFTNVPVAGSITINKTAIGARGSFTFEAYPWGMAPLGQKTCNTGTIAAGSTGSCTISDLSNGLYGVEEISSQSGWSYDAGSCGSAINVGAGNVSCAATNTYHSASVCSSSSDCGTNGLTGGLFCQNNGVYQNYITWTCNNPGTPSASCTSTTQSQLQKACSLGQTCNNGICVSQTTTTGTIYINKNLSGPASVAGTFTFTITNPNYPNLKRTATITIPAGQTAGSATPVTQLPLDGSYLVTETPQTNWSLVTPASICDNSWSGADAITCNFENSYTGTPQFHCANNQCVSGSPGPGETSCNGIGDTTTCQPVAFHCSNNACVPGAAVVGQTSCSGPSDTATCAAIGQRFGCNTLGQCVPNGPGKSCSKPADCTPVITMGTIVIKKTLDQPAPTEATFTFNVENMDTGEQWAPFPIVIPAGQTSGTTSQSVPEGPHYKVTEDPQTNWVLILPAFICDNSWNGSDTMTCNFENSYTGTPQFHCANNQCVSGSPGPGETSCNGIGDTTTCQPVAFHCSNNACVPGAAASGEISCSGEGDTVTCQPYFGCINNTCTQDPTHKSNPCKATTDCQSIVQNHFECDPATNQCISKPGPGNNSCSAGTSCAIIPPAYHCEKNQCVSGEGGTSCDPSKSASNGTNPACAAASGAQGGSNIIYGNQGY